MLELLTASGSIDDAYRSLCDEYDVDPELLRKDLSGLLEALVTGGLMNIKKL